MILLTTQECKAHGEHLREQSILFKTVNEITTPVPAKASGKIPSWLKGTLLRNGPGLFEFEFQKAGHIFDGMAMLRRYHVDSTHLGTNISRKEKKNPKQLEQGNFLIRNVKRFSKWKRKDH